MNQENYPYQIQGQSLLDLAKEFGAPLYIYDVEKIEGQYKRLKKAFSGVKTLKINYAVKSNTNLNILKVLQRMDSGADCVSIQEVQLCIKAGFALEQISYTPNGVSFEEVQKAIDFGVKITLDNFYCLEKFGEKYPNQAVSLRINPHVMAGGNHKISVGHIDSKFGISIYQIDEIKEMVAKNGTTINGIHMHTGSDIYNIEAFLQATEVLLGVVNQFKDIEFVDFGSGFKVPYKEGDNETNIEEMGLKISKRFNAFCGEYGRDLALIFEPGKFLVSESGSLLVKVNAVKTTPNIVFAAVDSGLNHLVRPMMYDAYHHITNISNPQGELKYYSVVGYICETDTFGSDRKISEIAENDLLCIHNAGAYSFSMSSNYNSRYRPAEIMLVQGKAHLIRRRENMEDLISTTVEANF